MFGKKGAVELSMGTIVVLVLAMAFLILGLVLVRTIFTGAQYNVETINDKVRDQINGLFTEDEKMVIYLANQKLDISQGENWGVAFAVKNLLRGQAGSQRFVYAARVNMQPDDLARNCGGLSVNEAESWIRAGKTGSLTLNPGETGYDVVRFSIPEGAPLCFIRYSIDVQDPSNPGSVYVSRNFDVNIE